MTDQSALWTPNGRVSQESSLIILIGWVVIWMAWWTIVRPAIFPTPLAVAWAFPDLWMEGGLGQAIASSLQVNIIAMVMSIAIAFPVAYLSRVPALVPVASGLAKMRFLSPAVFFMLLLFLVKSASWVKVWMLTLGTTFFLTTTMVSLVQSIPEAEFDDAKLLHMSAWTATWYVVVRGTFDRAFDAVRENAAMGWGMLMMVEGFVRSEGGVGVLLLNQERVMNLANVYAIAGAILLVGIAIDYVLANLKNLACPYAALETRR